MPLDVPTPEELERQRAELHAVLASELFSRAPTLAHLLSYLCEKNFAGESSQIKEYSIGVEVFHRGEGFDQELDSIVRVQANRLRKRLAEFYEGGGSTHSLRITIPIGQYVPHFEPQLAAGTPEAVAVAAVPVKTSGSFLFRHKDLILWTLASLLLFSLIAAAVLGSKLLRARNESVVTARQQAEELRIGPPAGDEVRILAGASRGYVDHAGKLWSADTGFNGGQAVQAPQTHIWRTLEPEFYRSSRQGKFSYTIPLRPGNYELRLHFAETAFGPENGSSGEGSRIMTVSANGKVLLEGFDVIADAGQSDTADVKVFRELSPAADGNLHLSFEGERGEAMLAAIEILPGLGKHIRPVRLLARQTPYYSNDSRWWSPDSYFEGGQLASFSESVGGSEDSGLYESERWGHFNYALPVAPGKYTLTLYFASRRASSTGGAAEGRVFNVFCNGRALLQNFELRAGSKGSEAITRRFNNLEPNSQGKLFLEFVPVKGYAALSGLEVAEQ